MTKHLLSSALLILGFVGCQTIHPTQVEKKSLVSPEGGLVDGGIANGACRACMDRPNDPGPGCADEIDSCSKNPKCKAEQVCFWRECALATKKADVFQCGIKCFDSLDVAVLDTPAILAWFIYRCSIGVCGPDCYPADPPWDTPKNPTLTESGASCSATSCPAGQYCCIVRDEARVLQSVACETSCGGPTEQEVCDPELSPTCHFGGTCMPGQIARKAYDCQ